MKITNLKCPYCGAPLEAENEGYVECKFCHNSFYCEEDKPPVTINNTINNFGDVTPPPSNVSPAQKNTLSVLLGVLLPLLVIVAVIALSTVPGMRSAAPSATSAAISAQTAVMKEEPLLAEFVKVAYRKNSLRDLTAKDLAAMKSIQITSQETSSAYTFQITYILADAPEQSVSITLADAEKPAVNYMAFSVFNKLEAFGWDTDLSASDDISGLSAFVGIQSLSIKDHDKITDFSVLSKCTGLTDLSVSGADGLTDLSAVKYMPKLKSLCLQDTSVTDISPLNGKLSMMSLTLENNPIEDMSAVATLKSLTSLHVNGYSGTMPELGELKLLKDYELNGETMQ